MEQAEAAQELSDAIFELGNAMGKMSIALRECRSAGMDQNQIRDAILENIPEEDKAQFMAQWPMLSMMLAAL